jgi:threonine/homoserine/homoserine lactone efflux protein
MFAGALALFTTSGGNKLAEVGLIAFLFGAACFPNGIVWALFGRAIARFLQDDRTRLLFNIGMAVILVGSAIPELFLQ